MGRIGIDTPIDRSILTLRLYRIFGIKDEDYATTTKLIYIYDWIAPRAGDVSLDVITAMREYYLRDSNAKRVDAFYNELKLVNMNTSGRYDTSSKKVPMNRNNYYLGQKV